MNPQLSLARHGSRLVGNGAEPRPPEQGVNNFCGFTTETPNCWVETEPAERATRNTGKDKRSALGRGAITSDSIPPGESPQAPSQPGVDELVGQVVDGRYQVEAVIGEGSMGLVYRCRHTGLDKQVALKVLRRELARDEHATDRFRHEAKAASAIGNEHIIKALDFGTLPDGSTYMVMEYLQGETLGELLKKQPLLPFNTLMDITIQVVEALSAAHRAGVVHRDLKPDNLFLVPRDGSHFVKILDFGIAKIATSQSKLTRAGMVFGTPHYMSPEQAAGGRTDHRADIYTVGVILYELAVGELPFDAETAIAVLSQHIHEEPVPPSHRVLTGRELPRGLEMVVLRCLAKSPDERYQSVDELLADLRRVQHGLELSGTGRFNWLKSWSPRAAKLTTPARWPYLVVGLLAGVLGIGVGVAVLWDRIRAALSIAPARSESPQLVTVGTGTAPTATDKETLDAGAKPNGKRVDFVLFPLDARLYRGKEDLGMMPVSVTVPAGETLTLFVKRTGYWPRRVRIDGSKSRIVVGLRPITQAKPPKDIETNEDGIDEAPEREANQTQPAPASEAKPSVGEQTPRAPEPDKAAKPAPTAAGEPATQASATAAKPADSAPSP